MSGHSFDSYPNGIAALIGPDAIPGAGFLQIFFFIGFLELCVMRDSANGAAPGAFPGDFRVSIVVFRKTLYDSHSWNNSNLRLHVVLQNGALDFGWDKQNEKWQMSKRAVELNNGRAAMMGVLGLMVHEKLGEIGMAADLPIIGVLK